MMKRFLIAAAILISAVVGSIMPAAAQSCPLPFSQGMQLTPGQWTKCFNDRQPALGYTPVNKAGDAMQGRLVTFPSSTTQAGFNIPAGVAPTSPTNGDMWTTAAGLYVRINGVTVGPLAPASAVAFAATSPITVSFPSNVVTYAFDFSVANTWTATQTLRTILAGTTNTYDIGTSATVAAFRTIYAGTSFVGPIGTFTTSVAVGGATIGSNALAVTGTTQLTGALAVAGAQAITSSSASALVVGLNGGTNPALKVDASTALSATGLQIKSAAAAGGLALSVITSGTNENLAIDAAGAGTITLGGTSTGAIIHTRATTLSAALTYGGVTLSNAVTGTGNMVLSASPTLSGTIGGTLTFSGGLTLSSALTYGGVTLTNAVTGTGSMVLSASAALTGTPTAPTAALHTNTTQIASTAFVVAEVAGSVAGVASYNLETGPLSEAPVCGRMAYSGTTAITFTPFGCEKIRINGQGYLIPAAGIAGCANTSIFLNGSGSSNLANSTFYYVYAFINSATVTCDFRTGAHATSATAGNIGTEILSGNDTRTLIGMVYTNSSGQFQSSATCLCVASWFNRTERSGTNGLTSSYTLTTSLADAFASNHVQFLAWADEGVRYSANIGLFGSTTLNVNLVACPNFNGGTSDEACAFATTPVAVNQPIQYLGPNMTKTGLTEAQINYATAFVAESSTTGGGSVFGTASAASTSGARSTIWISTRS